jgi:23S rRNA (adenine2030-N6)-methyltransferase
VARADTQGFGLLGSSVFVANPPHTLAATLEPALDWLALHLAQKEGATAALEVS